MTVSFAQSDMPHVRGRLVEDAPLSRLSWFRTGGHADMLFEPADEDDLLTFLRAIPQSVPLTVLGVGSNLLVRDGGVEGLVVRLGRGFSDIHVRGDSVSAGAGAMDVHVAKAACDGGVGGLEFLVGVPGTIGGAVKMNAGAYGRELRDVFVHCHAVDRAGHCVELSSDDLAFDYRVSALDPGLIITKACLQGSAADPAVIKAKMTEISAKRADAQPIGTRTGGSTFKIPDPAVSEFSAWELVDQAGCRGLRVGDAMVSEKHANFLINLGAATAADIETLGETVRDRVQAKTGVTLEWEIKRIGRAADQAAGSQNGETR